MSNTDVFYGFPDQCGKFEQRHPLWQETSVNLEKAIDLAFIRVQTMNGHADKLVYFFGSIVAEDFREIALVCYHGFGVAASKLVRSMYEYAVTLRYLHEHPDEADTFMAYHFVQQDKLMSRVIDAFGEDIVAAEKVAEIKSKAADIRKDFMLPICEHPDAKMRVNHSWNKLNFVSMAQKTGALGEMILPGYYLPILHAHPTYAGLNERFEVNEGSLGLKTHPQPEIADRSLVTAHNCLLNALDVQNSHFIIEGLEPAIKICVRDFLRIWSPDSPLLNG